MARTPNTSPQTLRVLALLLETPRDWHYGYAVSQITGLKAGTLYPILARLTDQGWLERRWQESEEPGRPPRHTYRLTAVGKKAAREVLAQSFHAGVLRPAISTSGR